jgi:hypothetical protein
MSPDGKLLSAIALVSAVVLVSFRWFVEHDIKERRLKGMKNGNNQVGPVVRVGVEYFKELRQERDTLREQIGMIREYNHALRQERDTLREDYRQLEEIRKDLMRRCERMKSLEGMSLDEIAARQLEREATLRAEAARLREALEQIRGPLIVPDSDGLIEDATCTYCDASSVDGCDEDCPREIADAALSTTTAELAAARDAEQRWIGAEEALTKAALSMYDTEAAEEYTNQVVQWLRDRAASLRAGKGE